MTTKVTIGISSCLLGEKVRYDGTAKRDDALVKKLHQHFALLPICPEVEIGMPVPRERLNLVTSLDDLKMVAEETGKDWTIEMAAFSTNRILQSDFQNISGLILKSRSPSCGINTVKVYEQKQHSHSNGTGIFANVVIAQIPNLPIIDETSVQSEQGFAEFFKKVTEFSLLK